MTPSAANGRILAGGRIVGPDLLMARLSAVRTVADYRFDWAIIACLGVDGNAALDFDADTIAVKQQAMALSAAKALVVDSTKFSGSALMQVAAIDAFDRVVTDAPPPTALARWIAQERLRLA